MIDIAAVRVADPAVHARREGSPISQVVVVVPARNEQRRIKATLESIHVARVRVERDVRVSVVVVADDCMDTTAAIARTCLTDPGDLVIEASMRCVGAARALGVAHVLRCSPGPLSNSWISNTDADTLVPPGWIESQLDLAARGVAAVVGTARLRRDEQTDPRLISAFERRYMVALASSHRHVHGANLGLRADAYFDVGGWPAQCLAEDVRLVALLAAAGWPVRYATDLLVHTSGRRTGRSPGGVSADLALLESSGP